jgi:transcriptional regulator with XRE-family HTH domain
MSLDLVRRSALGGILRVWRAAQGLSAEALAARVGLGHMTLRRIEDGHPVRPKSYRLVEEHVGLPTGLIFRALKDNDALIELAGHLGIDTSDTETSSTAFLRSFAVPGAGSQQLTSPSTSPEDDLPAVGALVARLTARRDRSEVEDAALKALAAWLAELTGH